MGRQSDSRLSELTLEELLSEVARRKGCQLVDNLERLDAACHKAGVDFGLAAFQSALDHLSERQDCGRKPCPGCGADVSIRSHDRAREVWCVDGIACLRRHYYYCDGCGRGFYPLDVELGLPSQGRLSQELEKRLADFAINDSFREGAERFSLHYSLNVSEKLLRDVADRVGNGLEASHDAAVDFCVQPPRKRRHKDDKLIVQTDGCQLPVREQEGWREAKLATLFHSRDHLSKRQSANARGIIAQTRYVGILGYQAEFRQRLDTALRMEHAGAGSSVVWIADGAKGNWSLAEALAPECIQILDWYHAMEHANDCAKIVFGEESPWLSLWAERIAAQLMTDKVAQVLQQLEECLKLARGEARKAVNDLLRYYRRNAERMRYGSYLAQGLPIGSGKVESGHRHTLQRRMKNAGQHWSTLRARRMVQMRCLYQSVGPDRFYETICRALRITHSGKIPKVGWQKTRASNRG